LPDDDRLTYAFVAVFSFLRSLTFAVLTLATVVVPVSAHHGKDFLLVESYEVPHPWDFYFASSVAVIERNGRTALESEPSVLFGVLPRLAFELHAHVSREESERLMYAATAPAFHLQLTSPHSDFPVRLGLSGEYESATASHDRAELRLVIERDLGHSRIALNLIGEHEIAGASTMGYAAGYRYEITEKVACGFEAQGEITNKGHHDLIAAIYSEPNERITLKAGAGVEIGQDKAAATVRMGWVYRF